MWGAVGFEGEWETRRALCAGVGTFRVQRDRRRVIGYGGMRCGSQREEPVVTDRDRSVVAWLAVVGAVSAQDVMARFGVGRTVGYRRLRALVDHGRFTRARLVYGQPALYVATREGWAWLPRVDPARVNVSTTRP